LRQSQRQPVILEGELPEGNPENARERELVARAFAASSPILLLGAGTGPLATVEVVDS
jgi:hypothetical protein